MVDVIEADPALCVVAEAGTVLEALRRAAAVRPDVAVIDLRLPDGTGIDLVRGLRQDQQAVRCVVLTSFDDEAVTVALEDRTSPLLTGLAMAVVVAIDRCSAAAGGASRPPWWETQARRG